MSAHEEAWARLRRLTPARIGLGRAGDGLPTRALLEFELAHARALDAVRAELDVVRMREQFEDRMPGRRILTVRSQALNQEHYLQRPDLGGRLHPDDAQTLSRADCDVVFILADGLSALAVHDHAVETLARTLAALPSLEMAPVVIAQHARVALGDPIGEALGARLSVVLIGERPGLSSPDSLGAYLTFAPRTGRTNAERNCVSNIRIEGLHPELAGPRIAMLISDALRLKLTGVGLKDRSDASLVDTSRREIGD